MDHDYVVVIIFEAVHI